MHEIRSRFPSGRLYAELVGSGADVQDEPVSRPRGLVEFAVRDVARNRRTVCQTFE